MKYIHLLTSGFLLAACSNHSFKISAIPRSPTIPWYFNHLTAFAADEGVKVHGHMTGNWTMDSPVGHIDIIAYNPEGQVLDKTTISHLSRISDRRARKSSLHFSTMLKKLPPEAIIQVMFHLNSKTFDPSPHRVFKPINHATTCGLMARECLSF